MKKTIYLFLFVGFLWSAGLHAEAPMNKPMSVQPTPTPTLTPAPIEGVFDASSLLKVIEGQLAAIRQGKFDVAYNDFTSTDFRKSTTLEQYKQLITSSVVMAKNRTFQLHSYDFDSGMAIVQGALVASTGETEQVEYDFVQEGGNWKIFGFQSMKSDVNQLTPHMHYNN